MPIAPVTGMLRKHVGPPFVSLPPLSLVWIEANTYNFLIISIRSTRLVHPLDALRVSYDPSINPWILPEPLC